MKKVVCLVVLLCVGFVSVEAKKKQEKTDYVILASQLVGGDAAWKQVVDELQKKHNAAVFYYDKMPRELLAKLKETSPRYVAIVEKPEKLNRDYIIDFHQVSREVDEDVFADFLWGVITGYDAAAAMKMVNNSTEPLVIKDAVATIMELHTAKWFDRYAWVDDHKAGLWGEKKGKGEAVVKAQVAHEQVLRKFTDLYAAYDPDLVVTAAHATERNLEMPFSLGNLKARNGALYAEDRFSREEWDIVESGKRKVYFAVGNCLIGNVDNKKESMAIAWMNSANAATMVGYVVPTWHGRNGWGGLKYWVTTPGRYSLAEAIFLNQQDFLYQQSEWNPVFIKENYPHSDNFMAGRSGAYKTLTDALGTRPDNDQLGFWHDRDVLAYYGDPKWNVRLQEIPEETDFTVSSVVKKNQCVITVKTKDNFSLARMLGDKFKEEHVLDLPFSYFFPERLNNPRLAPGQEWKVATDENFLLLYNPSFEAGKTYTIILDIN